MPHSEMTIAKPGGPRAHYGYVLAAVLIISSFLLGGSPRPEVGSLAPLRGLAALLLGLGLASLTIEQLKPFRFLFLLALASLLLIVAQLVPLPPGVANGLPGHAVIAAIDAQAALGEVWRPLTMTPEATRNALWSLLVPLAALVLAIGLSVRQHRSILALLLMIGAASGTLAVLQLSGDPYGPLFFFETTNNGSAVGLFANRNHQAAFLACLPPLAFALARLRAAQASRKPTRPRLWLDPWLALAFATVLLVIPLVLVTGSRSGMIVTLLGLVCIPLLITGGSPRQNTRWTARRGWVLAALLSLVIVLVAVTLWQDRAVAIDRLYQRDAADDLRVRIIPTVREIVAAHWPLGSGLGSFEQVFQIHEPGHLLSPTYRNHAHNDWLELVMTGGLPALILMVAGSLAWLVTWFRHIMKPIADGLHPLRMAGLVVLLILGLASVTDYPLRTPALSGLFVLAAVWAALPAQPARRAPSRADDHNDLPLS